MVYEYDVGSKIHNGSDGLGNDFAQAKIGDRVIVFYDPKDPTVSTLGNPERDFWQLLILASVFSAVTGALAWLSLLLLRNVMSNFTHEREAAKPNTED